MNKKIMWGTGSGQPVLAGRVVWRRPAAVRVQRVCIPRDDQQQPAATQADTQGREELHLQRLRRQLPTEDTPRETRQVQT